MTEWISIKDRLPEKAHKDFLITNGKNTITIGHLGNYLKTWFYCYDCLSHGNLYSQEVTHWMPLPETPK
jgi:hypothetical protein